MDAISAIVQSGWHAECATGIATTGFLQSPVDIEPHACTGGCGTTDRERVQCCTGGLRSDNWSRYQRGSRHAERSSFKRSRCRRSAITTYFEAIHVMLALVVE